MYRVMDKALEIGATFYSGYGPLNALDALHQMDKAIGWFRCRFRTQLCNIHRLSRR